MGYQAKVICDSVADGVRLTTLEVTLPRIVLAELNTHRMLSRNSASSRAIPVEKRIQAVLDDPFVPEAFGANKRGMQAGDALDASMQAMSKGAWMCAMRNAVQGAKTLAEAGVHKQWANRLLEPFSWHTIVVTATEWENFFNLRISPEAQPEIRRAAELMRDVMDASTPSVLGDYDWHLPYVTEADLEYDPVSLGRISSARCARVSYLTHEGVRNPQADLDLASRLRDNGHMSPFEHAAYVAPDANRYIGNFRAPWHQYRKMIDGESVFRKITD